MKQITSRTPIDQTVTSFLGCFSDKKITKYDKSHKNNACFINKIV